MTKPVTSATIVSPTPKMPATSPSKVSKFATDDKFPDFKAFKKPTHSILVQPMPPLEEIDETDLPKPIPRPSAPKHSAPAISRTSQEDLRRTALLNRTSSSNSTK